MDWEGSLELPGHQNQGASVWEHSPFGIGNFRPIGYIHIPMAVIENPALNRFVAAIGTSLTLAQVMVRRMERGYDLRHVADDGRSPEALKLANVGEARSLAQFTAAGAFRPLKSAPNLQTGWRIVASDDKELDAVLNQLYPGAIADWYAAQQANPPVTHFREFTQRQSGMYRITTKLDDAQAAQVTRACCASQFCLKQRLWTVGQLAPDSPADKSMIPCLEPCAVLLEFARTAMRIEQQERVPLGIATGEAATIHAALKAALFHPEPDVREADFSEPQNPRRLQLVLEKLQPVLGLAGDTESD